MKYKIRSCRALLCAAFACLGLQGCGGGENGSGGASAPLVTSVGTVKSANEVESAKEAMRSDEAAYFVETQQSSAATFDRRAATALSNSHDPRSGVYYLYAADGTNGTRQKLGINFDTRSYTLTDDRGQATSGTFSEDPAEPGTYVFASSRITSAANTARFRLAPDAVVGAFPFEKPWSNPTAYQVMPFVAARAFVTDPTQLDGNYNSFGIIRKSDGTSDSQALTMRITGHGTTLETCFGYQDLHSLDSCPTILKRTYAITASPDFTWTGTSNSPADVLQFRMARIGAQNILLSGGYTDTAPDTRVFQIGLPDAPVSGWTQSRYIGAATDGSWGANVFGNWDSIRTAVTPEGTVDELSLPLASIGRPQGVRLLNSAGTKRYYAMFNGTLSVVIGRPIENARGYMEVSLYKDSWNARNGHYTVFTTNGTEQTLDIDFDKKLYTMTAPGGDATTGTFSEDPNDPGTYIFANRRITAASNTARFRTKIDAIVGGFPFALFKSNPVAYAVQPFIAVRSFVTQRSGLAGTYDVIVTAGGSNNLTHPGAYWQLYIDAAGTVARQCLPATIACLPEASLGDYAISPGASPGIWVFTRDEKTSFTGRVARIDGRNVMLQASESYSPYIAPSSPLFPYPIWTLNTGFPRPTGATNPVYWPAMRMHIASTGGTFGTASLDATRYATSYSRPDGTSDSLALEMQGISGNAQVREGTDSTGTRYQLAQNGVIALMQAPWPFDNLHIGLAD
ncbi:hypothetical protein [Variovorax sp. 350MFTsu5.1]|uniref:hypothetical protein n=1 Tax=Variovorax sp. 350MFTsu5.1 TaxID=3158365 RepID=UPI003AB0802E